MHIHMLRALTYQCTYTCSEPPEQVLSKNRAYVEEYARQRDELFQRYGEQHPEFSPFPNTPPPVSERPVWAYY